MKLNYEKGHIPTKFELRVGEIAYNVIDDVQYTKLKDDSIVIVGGPDYLEWSDFDDTSHPLTTTPTKLLTLTTQVKLDSTTSVYQIDFVVDNPTGQAHTVSFHLHVNGVEATSVSNQINKNELGRSVDLRGVVSNTHPVGTVLDIYVNDDSGVLILRGDTFPTRFRIRKHLDRPIVVG